MRNWQPISTAPTDGTRVLLCKGQGIWRVVVGRYDDDSYATRPRPFWRYEGRKVTLCRLNPPTHWMPLPEPTDA